MSFVKLDCGILDSTLWVDREAREIFITALLMAKPFECVSPLPQIEVRGLSQTGFVVTPGLYGFVAAAGQGIVRRAGIDDLEIGMAALERLGNPEVDSRTPDFEGRRLVRVDGGYVVLNFRKYRDKDHTAAQRMRKYRAKKSGKSRKKVAEDYEARERRFIRAVDRGDEQQADQIAAEGL